MKIKPKSDMRYIRQYINIINRKKNNSFCQKAFISAPILINLESGWGYWW